MADHNAATRLLGVINDNIERKTKSGAHIEVTYGQVFALSGAEASVYLAGSRELAESDGGTPEPSEGFRVLAGLNVKPNDYVKVNMDSRGARWIDEVFLTATYAKLALDPNSGQLLTGSGFEQPTFGQPGQSLVVASDGLSLEYENPWDMVFLPFAYSNPAASLEGVAMKAVDATNPAASPLYPNPFEVRVMGLSLRSSSARTAGSLTARVVIPGTTTALMAVINGTNTFKANAITDPALAINYGAAGTEIGISLTTTSDWAPTTNYLYGGVYVLVRRPSFNSVVASSFTANAVLRTAEVNLAFTADAEIRTIGAYTFTADAEIDAPAAPPPPPNYATGQLGTTNSRLGNISLGDA